MMTTPLRDEDRPDPGNDADTIRLQWQRAGYTGSSYPMPRFESFEAIDGLRAVCKALNDFESEFARASGQKLLQKRRFQVVENEETGRAHLKLFYTSDAGVKGHSRTKSYAADMQVYPMVFLNEVGEAMNALIRRYPEGRTASRLLCRTEDFQDLSKASALASAAIQNAQKNVRGFSDGPDTAGPR